MDGEASAMPLDDAVVNIVNDARNVRRVCSSAMRSSSSSSRTASSSSREMAGSLPCAPLGWPRRRIDAARR
jgi:hypothetical protein